MIELKIDQPTREAMQVAADHLAEVHRLDAAIDAATAAVTAAEAEFAVKSSELSTLEADLALQIDAAEAKAIEAKIKKARASAEDERQTLERQKRVAAVLGERLLTAEANLQTERVALQTAVDRHANECVARIAAEVQQSCGPLIAALKAAHVLQAAVHNSSLGHDLGGFQVPCIGRYGVPIIDGARVNVGTATKALTEGWQDDALLVELHATAAAPRLALAKLAGYRTRVERMKVVEPYVIKSYSHSGRNDTWSGIRAPTTTPPSRPSASPVVRASAHAPQASPSRPTAARAPITPSDLNVGSTALADPAFAQFR